MLWWVQPCQRRVSVCTCTETIFEDIKYQNMNLNMISYDFEKRKTHIELESLGVFNSSSFLEGQNLSKGAQSTI